MLTVFTLLSGRTNWNLTPRRVRAPGLQVWIQGLGCRPRAPTRCPSFHLESSNLGLRPQPPDVVCYHCSQARAPLRSAGPSWGAPLGLCRSVGKSMAPVIRTTAVMLEGKDSEFRLGLRVVDQPHLIARRAACMTSSWVRPVTPPEESSRSRRTESCKATPSSAASNPASMLCQSAWANKTLSESGRAMASSKSCCWADMQKQVTIDATPVNPGLKPCGHTTNGVTRARVWLLVGWLGDGGWLKTRQGRGSSKVSVSS